MHLFVRAVRRKLRHYAPFVFNLAASLYRNGTDASAIASQRRNVYYVCSSALVIKYFQLSYLVHI